jgi:hypothetical protein
MDEPIEKVEKGWHAIKRAPWHFAGALVPLVGLGWYAIYLHYAAVVSGKDATIESKNAVIESKEATILASQQSLQAIQQTVTAKDDLIISLTNQYHKILAFQAELATTQTNLLQQQKKIEDVEFLVENLFSKMTNENIAAADTNRVVVVPRTDCTQVIIKLQHAPIAGSLQVTIKPGGGLPIPQTFAPVNELRKNLIFACLVGYDLASTSFDCRYVRDTRETNLVQRMKFSKGLLWLDGKPTRLNITN